MKKSLVRYLIPLSIFSFGLFVFVYFSHNRAIQVWCAFGVSAAYFLWGIIYHYLENKLHLKIVLEYFLVALLGALLIISLIYKA